MTATELLDKVDDLAERLDLQAQDISHLEKRVARTKLAKKLQELDAELAPKITLKESLTKELETLSWQYLKTAHKVGEGSMVSLRDQSDPNKWIQPPFIITGVRLRKLCNGQASLYVFGIDAEKNVVHCVNEPKPVMVEVSPTHRLVDESF